jgi:sugar (pentulose or hexulose) kinase
VPGHYNTEIQITRGFWMVSWFKEQFGLFERQLALQRGVAPETLFDELVNAVPPGSLGLMLQPFWNPGIKVPGPEAKGAIIGFGDVHNRAHLYRAILEGLAYALREARSASSAVAAGPSRGCACPAAARRATRRCRSPPTSSTCRASARTCTRPAAWAPPCWPP